MKKVVFFLVFALFTSGANAANPKWFKSEIKTIYPLATGDFVLMFKEDNPNCSNGSTNKYHYVREGENGVAREGVKTMLSTALTAASTGRKVTINFDADTSQCYINRLSVNF